MKSTTFKPDSLPALIGSLPLKDHDEATSLVFEYTPEIPLWVQLPHYKEERLLTQFAEGLPGIKEQGDDLFFDTEAHDFDEKLLFFFEQYLAVTEGDVPIADSIFAFSEKTGKGFNAFLRHASANKDGVAALKGQITGPFTMSTGLKDRHGKDAYYHPQLRDAVTKAIAMKAKYQVEEMKKISNNVIIFLDEPGLSGYGSSSMVGIPRDEIINALSEATESIHQSGGLSGIHVCANTDWSLIFSIEPNIISFDAYGFFDRIILYKKDLSAFIKKGGIIAWGLVPTLNVDDLRMEDSESLYKRWEEHAKRLDLPMETIKKQSLITPSCGTGLLPLKLAVKALKLTRELSQRIRD